MLKTYYRLTKPGIIYGNAITAVAGFLLASKNHLDFVDLVETLLGISLVIASACVINNVIDRNIDKYMARTKKRALVTGEIKLRDAIVYGVILGILGFGFLSVFTNLLTVVIGIVGYIDYIIFYGYYKRRSMHGTIIGSISGAVPILAGYCSVTDKIDIAAILLFLILVFWQMPHFYAISIGRLKDYTNARLPVLPVAKGIAHTKYQIVVYITLFVITSLLPTVYGYTGIVYMVVMSILGLVWLYISIEGFSAQNDQKWAQGLFRYSLLILLVFSVLISFGRHIV